MPVPCFPDVGKKLRNLFDEGYPFALFKLNTRWTTCTTRQYCVDASQNFDTGAAYFEASTRRKYPLWGLSYVSKFNTNSVASTDIHYRTTDFIFSIGGDYNVDTQDMKDRANIQFKTDFITVDLKGSGGSEPSPTLLTGSFVCGLREYLTGIQVGYDVTQGSIKSQNALIGYRNCGLALTAGVNNMDTLALGLYYNPPGGSWETGLLTKLKLDDAFSTDTSGEATSGPGDSMKPSDQIVTQLGVKYRMDPFNTFRGKVDSNGMIGIAQDIKLKSEVTLTLGLLINGKNLWEGDIVGEHKVGLGLDFKG